MSSSNETFEQKNPYLSIFGKFKITMAPDIKTVKKDLIRFDLVDFSGFQWILVDFSGFQWILVDFSTLYKFSFFESQTFQFFPSLKLGNECGIVNLCRQVEKIFDLKLQLEMTHLGFQGSLCCGYGADGKATSGYDCILLPGDNFFSEQINNPLFVLPLISW